MSHFRIHVRVMPRRSLLDPQGQAVATALGQLGFDGVRDVRIGKSVFLDVEAPDAESARSEATTMCQRLLANPVTEDFELLEVEAN